MPSDASRRSPSASGARRIRPLALVALAGAVSPLAAACGASTDGRALAPPSPAQTTTTTVATSVPTTAGVDAESGGDGVSTTPPAEPMVLTSPVIPQDGEIPVDHTCRGADRSPPLSWTPAPVDTVELAVVVRDVDLDGFVQWVITGIDPLAGGLAEDTPPQGAVEATNDFGRPGWAGPCPTDGPHHYDIRVYALTQPSGVTAGQPGAEAAATVEATPAAMSAVLSAWAAPGPAGG